MKQVILTVGPSGSGKSTWARKFCKKNKNFVTISADELRIKYTGDINNKSKDSLIYDELIFKVMFEMSNGKNVIIDTTNLDRNRRWNIYTQIKRYSLIKPDFYYKLFPVSAEVAKQRIKNDLESGVYRANVPDETIKRHVENYIKAWSDLKNEPIKPFQLI